MYCQKCGTQNPDNNQLCNACGATMTTETTAPAQALVAKTSKLAIAALVLGIMTCTLITTLPAVILGIIALIKISKSRGQLKGTGLAITGIIIPCVWMLLVIPLMMGIMMPALARARTIAQRRVCAANMNQVAITMKMHADEHGKFPDPSNWCDALQPYYGNNQAILVCKSAVLGRSHYALNPNAKTDSPPDMVLLFETGPGWNQSGGPELLSPDNHKGKGCNIVFCDFHFEFVRTEQFENLKWE